MQVKQFIENEMKLLHSQTEYKITIGQVKMIIKNEFSKK